MINWTFEKMVSSLKHQAAKLDLEVELGTEDGFKWVTLWGDRAAPKHFEQIASMVADSTGRDFYAQSARVGSICGALDADPSHDKNAEPFHYLKRHIESYGTKFEPSHQMSKYQRSEPTEDEVAMVHEFSGICDAASQARVEALFAKNPSLSSARLVDMVMEV